MKKAFGLFAVGMLFLAACDGGSSNPSSAAGTCGINTDDDAEVIATLNSFCTFKESVNGQAGDKKDAATCAEKTLEDTVVCEFVQAVEARGAEGETPAVEAKDATCVAVHNAPDMGEPIHKFCQKAITSEVCGDDAHKGFCKFTVTQPESKSAA